MPRPVPPGWLRSFLRYALWLVPAWTLATFVCARLVFPEDRGLTLGTEWQRAAVLGAWAGVLGALIEAWVLPRFARRVPFGLTLGLRTFAYAGVVAFSFLAVIGFIARRELGILPRDLLADAEFSAFLWSAEFFWFFGLLLGASFLITLAFQVNRVLGPGTLAALLLGRYLRPVREERVFLFLDLTDSTPIAERLGPLRFSDFKNDFFHDVAGPVLATRGQIFQYVGDEVVVSWTMRHGTRHADCLRCFFLVEQAVEARRAWYEASYGTVPRFKAACHGGPVVTAEIGDLKRDIVHSGDTLNTTARIEGQCRPLGRRLLASETLLNRLVLPAGFRAEAVGAVPLRGVGETVRLFGVERSEAAHRDVPHRDASHRDASHRDAPHLVGGA